MKGIAITLKQFVTEAKKHYVYSETELACIRMSLTEKGQIIYVKFPGELEFKALDGSGLVMDITIGPMLKITKEEYQEF